MKVKERRPVGTQRNRRFDQVKQQITKKIKTEKCGREEDMGRQRIWKSFCNQMTCLGRYNLTVLDYFATEVDANGGWKSMIRNPDCGIWGVESMTHTTPRHSKPTSHSSPLIPPHHEVLSA